MAGNTTKFTTRKGRKAADTFCTGMIAQVAAVGWSVVHSAQAMTAEELQAHLRAIDRLGANAVSPDAVQYVRTIFDRELAAREAGKPVHALAPYEIDPEMF